MNPFAAIFYASLGLASFLVAIEYRSLKKRQPELFAVTTPAYQPWFIINLIDLEARTKHWFAAHIKPTLIRYSLRVLKAAQSGLQSMRVWIKRQTERLVAMDMRQQRRTDVFRTRNL